MKSKARLYLELTELQDHIVRIPLMALDWMRPKSELPQEHKLTLERLAKVCLDKDVMGLLNWLQVRRDELSAENDEVIKGSK